MNTSHRPSLPRPLLLGAAALFTLLLSACGTVTPPASTAGTDMDRLIRHVIGRGHGGKNMVGERGRQQRRSRRRQNRELISALPRDHRMIAARTPQSRRDFTE